MILPYQIDGLLERDCLVLFAGTTGAGESVSSLVSPSVPFARQLLSLDSNSSMDAFISAF
jgi:hypothetical protein